MSTCHCAQFCSCLSLHNGFQRVKLWSSWWQDTLPRVITPATGKFKKDRLLEPSHLVSLSQPRLVSEHAHQFHVPRKCCSCCIRGHALKIHRAKPLPEGFYSVVNKSNNCRAEVKPIYSLFWCLNWRQSGKYETSYSLLYNSLMKYKIHAKPHLWSLGCWNWCFIVDT